MLLLYIPKLVFLSEELWDMRKAIYSGQREGVVVAGVTEKAKGWGPAVLTTILLQFVQLEN